MGTATIAQFNFDTQKENKYLSTQPFPVSAWKEQLKIWQPEVPEDNFDKYREAARDNWNRQLL